MATPPPSGPGGAPVPDRVWTALALAALASLVLFVYLRAAGFGFVFDDRAVVLGEPMLRHGLSAGALEWAVVSLSSCNWVPLTRLSFLAEASLHGLAPGPMHAANALLHFAAAAALLLALRALTGSRWALAAAALFAVHPLNVEAVAWVAERSMVLSVMLAWLAVAAYAGYARRPGPARYLLTTALFALGLAAKPVVVTLPVLLLLLDWWPLGRLRRGASWRRALLEKVPWLAMSAAASLVAVRAQEACGAIVTAAELPATERLANAAISGAWYLRAAFWPAGLHAYYALQPGAPPAGRVVAAAGVLLVAATLAAAAARRWPALPAGLAWFAVALAPAAGLVVQVGGQARADRFAYLPLGGLAVALVWGLAALGRAPRRRAFAAALLAAATVSLALAARHQVAFWRDDFTLFTRVLAAGGARNSLAHYNLGEEYRRLGRNAEAMRHYREAVRIRPGYVDAHNNLGYLLEMEGDLAAAAGEYREALRHEPRHPGIRTNLGMVLAALGRPKEAAEQYRLVLRADPGYAEAYNGLGNLAADAGNPAEAARWFERALRLQPQAEHIRRNLEAARRALEAAGRR